jgi:hypothetical protein
VHKFAQCPANDNDKVGDEREEGASSRVDVCCCSVLWERCDLRGLAEDSNVGNDDEVGGLDERGANEKGHVNCSSVLGER